ncbi:MAG: LysR family transcriptional regulator [Bacteriovoracaceae bacterium]|nr:LysR family transcriptional regulator [Bacteriovoracaceae bacterium]
MNDFFDLESMYLFTKVLEAGSFSSVAVKTRIPKATLSRKIKELEDQVGAQLLIRTTRQVRATDIGREFLQRANTILAAVEDSKVLVKKASQELEGPLRITAGVEFGLAVLSPLVLKFQKLYPKINIEIDLTGRYVDLAYEGFDVGIRIGPLDDSSLNCRKIGSFSYGLFASPEFLKTNSAIKKISDLGSLPKLAFSRAGQRNEWKLVNGDKFEKISIEPKIVSNNYWVIEMAAIRGSGVAFMPRFLVTEALKNGELKPVLNQWHSVEIPIHLIYPSQRFISTKLRTFIDFIADEMKKGQHT